MYRRLPILLATALAACGSSGSGGEAKLPGDTGDTAPYDGIAENERVYFTGTEPFWGGDVHNGSLIWSTPENVDGEVIAVDRFAGRGGLSFSGALAGEAFVMTVTPSACSDGMSDRSYPYATTVNLGERTLEGCAWTDSDPYSAGEEPS